MFEIEVFRKQMHCIEESIYDIVGTFGAPIVTHARGIAPPLAPSLRPWAERFWAYRMALLQAIWIKCVLCSYFDKILCSFW